MWKRVRRTASVAGDAVDGCIVAGLVEARFALLAGSCGGNESKRVGMLLV